MIDINCSNYDVNNLLSINNIRNVNDKLSIIELNCNRHLTIIGNRNILP